MCHGSKCYLHTLTRQNVHAIEALLYTDNGDTDRAWHELHKKKEFDKAKEQLMDDEANGTRPVLAHKLVKTALDFGNGKPINPAVRPGWYDSLGWYDTEAQCCKVSLLQGLYDSHHLP